MVSVVIPTHNRANYLKEAINSVLSQTYRDFEVIVVDDASTDNTREIVADYAGKIRYILQENRERAAARNNGIRNAKGKYVAFLDSDDMWTPAHLMTCLGVFKNFPEAGVAYAGSYLIDPRGAIVGKLPFRPSRGCVLNKIVSSYSSGGCNASSCVAKREVFQRSGYFNETRELSGSEDWEMWVRMAADTQFFSSRKYTAKVRFHEGKSSINAEKMARSMSMALDLIYQNSSVAPAIAGLKKRASSSLYCITAINFYAAGDMRTSRAYLRKAFKVYPFSILTNKYLAYTLLRTFLGPALSISLRRMKWRLRKIS